jgi:hypothetical protein
MSKTETMDQAPEIVRDARDNELRSGDHVLVTVFETTQDESGQHPVTLRGRYAGISRECTHYCSGGWSVRVLLGNDCMSVLTVCSNDVILNRSWR